MLSGRRDLNSGPHRPERCALPGCATPRSRGLSQAGVAPRAIRVERDEPADPRRHGLDLDVVQQPVGLEDLNRGVDTALDPRAEGVGTRALERLTAHAAAAWANVPGQAVIERDPLRHTARFADGARPRKWVGWQDHPFGGYGWTVARRDEIVAFLDDHLDAGGYPDALPVGLQVVGAPEVRRVATGVSASLELFERAADAGADCFLTGEPREPVMAQAREAGIHFVAAGHYATEVFGVRALGELLAQRFGVEHAFIDVPNPI